MTFQEKLRRRMLYSHIRRWEDGSELLSYLCANYSRHGAEEWREEIRAENVLVNGKSCAPEQKLKQHDCVAYFPGELPEPEADFHCETVYEDDDILVFNKPGNLCVHPTGPFFRNTLWHWAGMRYGELRFVNRLDRETSGLLVAARTSECAAKMNNRRCPMRKEYLALVFGAFPGMIDARGYLFPDRFSAIPKKRRFAADGAEAPNAEFAETRFRVEKRLLQNQTLVRAIPLTGRQHQIRASLYSLGFPMLGDKLYGPDETLYDKIHTRTLTEADYRKLGMARQALHSAVLEFAHPMTGRTISCEAPLPADFLRAAEGKTR